MRSQSQSSSRSVSVTGRRLSCRCRPRAGRSGPLMDRTLELNLADLASVTDEVAAQPGVAQLAGALDSALPAACAVPGGGARAAPGGALAATPRRGAGSGLAVLVRRRRDRARGGRRGRLVRAGGRWSASCPRAASPTARVSSRRRTSSASARAGSGCSRPAGSWRSRRPRSSSASRRASAGPRRLHVERGGELVRDEAVAALVAAGYTRVERVGDRGELAVRGDILDVFPTTGAEPVRIELFGDEVERISRFSVFTQRSLAELERSDLQPAREARRAPADVEEWTHEEDVPVPNDLVSLAPELIAHGVVCAWQPDRVLDGGPRPPGRGRGEPLALRPRARLRERVGGRRPARGRQRARSARRATRPSRRSGPALAGRGISEAEAELLGLVRSGLRVVVAFPHRGDAERTQLALRRVDATPARPGAAAARRGGRRLRRLAAAARRGVADGAPGRRLGAAAVPAPRRGRRGRRAPRPRALERGGPATRRLRRARRARRRPLPRLRHEDRRRRHARLRQPPVQGRGPALRPARPAGQALALHRRRRPAARALEARRQGLAHAALARARGRARARRRAAAALRRAPDAHARRPTTTRRAGSSAWSARSPTPRPRIRAARSTRCSRISPASSRWTA